MKSYAQFFIKYNNNIQELLGSDGVLYLDNRFNIHHNATIAKNHIINLNKNLNKNICKFEIRNYLPNSFPFENYKIVYSESL